MTERCVIDASTGIGGFIPRKRRKATDELLLRHKQRLILIVPVIWFQETANALLVLERRNKLKPDDGREALRGLLSLNAEPDYDGIPLVFAKVCELAEIHRLSIYDVHMQRSARL